MGVHTISKSVYSFSVRLTQIEVLTVYTKLALGEEQ